MKILKGKQIIEINQASFDAFKIRFKQVIVDIGTGDGEFVYKLAKSNPENLYIGIDATAENMHAYSVKMTRKPAKGGLDNLLFVVANAAQLPQMLHATANAIYINLPWGSLRDGLVKADYDILENIRCIAKIDAKLQVLITYSPKYENQEIENRKLPILSLSYFDDIHALYQDFGLYLRKTTLLNNDALKKVGTKWANKLAFGKTRDIYQLNFDIR